MNTDILQQSVVNLINKSVDTIDKGVDWFSGQLPDLVHQLMSWLFIERLYFLLIFLCFLLISIGLIIFGLKYSKRDGYGNIKEVWFWILTVSWVSLFGCMIGIFINLYCILYIYIAPKIYLIEWMKGFVSH